MFRRLLGMVIYDYNAVISGLPLYSESFCSCNGARRIIALNQTPTVLLCRHRIHFSTSSSCDSHYELADDPSVSGDDTFCETDVYSKIPRPLLPRKLKSRRPYNSSHAPFVDHRRVCAKGGRGGRGMASFLSTKETQWAGPDGGDGGNGGHVIFESDATIQSLTLVPEEIEAKNGVSGRRKTCHGANAEHLTIRVPVGTLLKQVGTETILGSLTKPGQIFIAARGGAGGRGNHYFLSNENRAPMLADEGGSGEEVHLDVEMNVIAHAGLVGFPNAGKSSLLRAISRARPKVASYPFTTLKPTVGCIEYEDYEQLFVADIPGIIGGAHANIGLGLSFLRHVERCLCLFYVLDIGLLNPHQQLDDLQNELEHYQRGLSRRTFAVIANKMDLPGSREKLEMLREQLGAEVPVFPVSAHKRTGLLELLLHFRMIYDSRIRELSTTASNDS